MIMSTYKFIFGSDVVWQSQVQFEQDLAKYFESIGMSAEIVDTKDMDRVLYIFKKDIEPAVAEPVKTVKKIKAEMTTKRGYDGSFKKRNEA